jgi:DNA-binding transcriptional ArsR family regulator
MTGEYTAQRRLEHVEVLEAIADADCRAILAATAGGPLTAAELADHCAIPISTVYRKVGPLSAAGLLTERTRIRSSGPNCSEFVLRVRTVHIDLTSTDSVAFDRVVDGEGAIETDLAGIEERGRASTDGGTTTGRGHRSVVEGPPPGERSADDEGERDSEGCPR